MKIKTIIKSLGLAVLCSLVMVACDSLDDDFEELNINPTQADNIDPNFKLTNIQLRISGERYENWRTNLIYSSTMMQHIAALPGYWSGDKYLYNAGYSASMWDRYYPNISKNVEDLLLQTSEDPDDSNMYHITQITRVIMYHRLTDLYGDIPYSEAGKGFLEGITQPKYDSQEFVYNDMLTRLEEAALSLDGSKASFGSGDLLYQGDVEQWRKFAYSLMLRLGMRLVNVDPAGAEAWVQKAIAGGMMESNADIALVPHDGSAWSNGNSLVFEADGNPRLSSTFVSWMVDRNDPRLMVFGQTTDGADPVGMPNGNDVDTILEDPNWVECADDDSISPCETDVYMSPNSVYQDREDPMFFMTYSEVQFLLAEAALRGWHGGDPAAHYENGVRAAMEHLSLYGAAAIIESSAIDAYIAENPYDAANAMQQINEHIWAATFLNEYEAFANWRRTGYPELTPVDYPGNVTNGTIPRRMRYREAEAVANPSNYQEAVSRQGPDELTTRVWWDVQ